MFEIELLSKIDTVLERADEISGTKRRTTSEAVEELVKPIAAVKLSESVTESVTADSAPLPTSQLLESVTADPARGKPSESVTAGSSVLPYISELASRGQDPITVGSVVVSSARANTSESVTAGSPGTSIVNRNGCRVLAGMSGTRRHALGTCKEFVAMSVEARIQVVITHRDCTRCLTKGHQRRECHSKKVCYRCGGDHHYLLHDDPKDHHYSSRSRKTTRPRPYPSSESRPNVRSGSHPSVHTTPAGYHTASPLNLLSLQSVATLSPSLVVRIHCVGPSYPVRSVLDPCAIQSQICASMVDHLRLPTSNLDGVRFCRFSATSVYDPTQSIIVSARVTDLRHVFTPTEPISEKLKESFLGLPLADPSFYRPSRVALVLGPDVYAKVVTSRVQVSPGLPIAHYTIFGWVLSGVCYT